MNFYNKLQLTREHGSIVGIEISKEDKRTIKIPVLLLADLYKAPHQ